MYQSQETLNSLVTDKVVVFTLALFTLSVIIYRLQREVSPRVFFKMFFATEQTFDYFVKVDDHPHLNEHDVCAICYCEFKHEVKLEHQPEIHDISDSMTEYLSNNWQKIMRTPCNHFFHSTCLVTVMNYKANCPICRSALPPIDGN